MIVTCKKSIPFQWMLVALLPWSALTISQQVTGNAVVFSLKKFLENPAALTFVLSLPSFLSLLTITVTNFLSDRIWTRYGRRKPFVLVGFAGMATCLFLMPLMPNFWSLVAVYLLLGFFMDLDSPIEPLKQEIVPPQQRGRATGIMFWINQAAQLTFMFFIFGRFDDVKFMGGFPITGETGIYWCAGLIATSMLLLIALGIKETRQSSHLTGERLSLKTFIGGLTDRELLPVYILIFGAAVLHASTGPMGALLYTDQWGYTKQDMGTNIAIGGLLNLFLIALLTLLADRLNRLRAYQILILVSIGLNIAYYCYVHFVLPDRRPTLFEMVLFGEMMSITGILTGLVYTPLIYDYVVRNKMGTYVAGAQLVTRLTNLVTVNGAGLFIIGYAALFQPPAGEATRVALKTPTTAADVKSKLLESGSLHTPEGTPVDQQSLHVAVWNRDGMVETSGTGFEIRIRSQQSEALEDKRKDIVSRLNPLVEKSDTLKDRLQMAINAGDNAEAAQITRQIENLTPQIRALDSELTTLKDTLAKRSQATTTSIEKCLADHLCAPGSASPEIRNVPVAIYSAPLVSGFSRQRLEALLVPARTEFPSLIDIVPGEDGKSLEISFLRNSTTPLPSEAAVRDFLNKRLNGLFAEPLNKLSLTDRTGIEIDVPIVESPVPRRQSPVTAAIHHVQRLFGVDVPADARVLAAGRALRKRGEQSHASARADTNGRHVVKVLLIPDEPDSSPGNEEVMNRITKAFEGQKMSVLRPVLGSGFAPVKYDYMAGNLLTILLSFVGFGITMVFYRLNQKGIIRKWGVEEAEATR